MTAGLRWAVIARLEAQGLGPVPDLIANDLTSIVEKRVMKLIEVRTTRKAWAASAIRISTANKIPAPAAPVQQAT